MKPLTNYAALVAAGGWNLSTAFLSAKAKAQLRDSKGRFIPMGGIVRWKDGPGYRWGFVLGKHDNGDILVKENGKDYTAKIKSKQLEVVKALIPDSADEAKNLEEATAAAKQAADTGDAKVTIPTVNIKAKDLTPASPADDEEPDLYKDTAGFTKVGGQGGSNPGGTYQDPVTGEKFYVKKAKSEQHAANEVLASRLYDMVGINTPEVFLTEYEGEPGVASKIVPDLKAALPNASEAFKAEARKGFAMDAWLANWDVVGLGYDNLLSTPDGKPIRVDTGGALLYRAMGSPKGGLFGDKVGETETLRNASMNSQSAKLFGKMTDEDIAKDIADTVNKISDDDLDKLIDDLPFSSDAVKTDLKNKLKARREDLNTKFNVTDVQSTSAPNSDLDETAAPEIQGSDLQIGDWVKLPDYAGDMQYKYGGLVDGKMKLTTAAGHPTYVPLSDDHKIVDAKTGDPKSPPASPDAPSAPVESPTPSLTPLPDGLPEGAVPLTIPGYNDDAPATPDAPSEPPAPPVDTPPAPATPDEPSHPAAKIGAVVTSKKDGFSGTVVKVNPNSGYSLVLSSDGSKKLWRKWDTLDVTPAQDSSDEPNAPDAVDEPTPGTPVEIEETTAAINKAVMDLGHTLPEGGDEVPPHFDALIDKLVADNTLDPDEWDLLNNFFDGLQSEQSQQKSDEIWDAWKNVKATAGWDDGKKQSGTPEAEDAHLSAKAKKAIGDLQYELDYYQEQYGPEETAQAQHALDNIKNGTSSISDWAALSMFVDEHYYPTDEDGGPGFQLSEAYGDLAWAQGIDKDEVEAEINNSALMEDANEPDLTGAQTAAFALVNVLDTHQFVSSTGDLDYSAEPDVLKSWLNGYAEMMDEGSAPDYGPIYDAVADLANALGVPIPGSPDGPNGTSVTAAQLSVGDEILYSGEISKILNILSSPNGYELKMTLQTPDGGLTFATFLPDSTILGNKVATATAPSTKVPVASLKPGDKVKLLNGNDSEIWTLSEIDDADYGSGKTLTFESPSGEETTIYFPLDGTINLVTPAAAVEPAADAPTPGNPIATKDLKVGDVVFDEAGYPATVSFVAPAGNGQIHVAYNDYEDVEVTENFDPDHEWLTPDPEPDATPEPVAVDAPAIGENVSPSQVKPGMTIKHSGGAKYTVISVDPVPNTSHAFVHLKGTDGHDFPNFVMQDIPGSFTLDKDAPLEAPPAATPDVTPDAVPDTPKLTGLHAIAGNDLVEGDAILDSDGDKGFVKSVSTNSDGSIKVQYVLDKYGDVPFTSNIAPDDDQFFTKDYGNGEESPQAVSTPSAPAVPSGTLVPGSSHVFQDAQGKYVITKTGHVLREGDTVTSIKDGTTGKITQLELNAKYAKVKTADGKTKARQIDTLKPADGSAPTTTQTATPAAPAAPAAPSAPATPPATDAQSLATALSTGVGPDGTWPTGTTFTKTGTTQTPQMKPGDIVGNDHSVVEWSKDSTVKPGKQDIKFVGKDAVVTASKNNAWEIWEKDAPPIPANESSVKKNISSLKKNDYVSIDGKIETIQSIDQDLDGHFDVKLAGKPSKSFQAEDQLDYFGNTKLSDPNPTADAPGDLIPGAVGKLTPDSWVPGEVVGDSVSAKLTVQSVTPSATDGMSDVKFVGLQTTYKLPNNTPWTTWPKEDGQPLPAGSTDTTPDVTPDSTPDAPDAPDEPEAPPVPDEPIDPAAPYTYTNPTTGHSLQVPVGWTVYPGNAWSGQDMYLTDGLGNWAIKSGDQDVKLVSVMPYYKKTEAFQAGPLFEHPGVMDAEPHIEAIYTDAEKTDLLGKIDAYIAENASSYWNNNDSYVALKKLLTDPSGGSMDSSDWVKVQSALNYNEALGVDAQDDKWAQLRKDIARLEKKVTGTYSNEWYASHSGKQYHYDATERKALSSLGLSEDTLAMTTEKNTVPAQNHAAAAEIYAAVTDPERAAIIDSLFGAGTAKAILSKTRGSNFKPALSGNKSPYAATVPPLPSTTGKDGSSIKLGDTVIAADGQGGKAELITPDGRIRVRRADGTAFTRKGVMFTVTAVNPNSSGPLVNPASSAPYVAKPRPPHVKPDWSTTLQGTATAQQALDEVKKSNWAANHGYSFAADQDQIEDLDVHVSRILDKNGQELVELKFKVTPKHGKELHKRYSADPSWSSSFMQVEERALSSGDQLAKLTGTHKVTSNHSEGWTLRHQTSSGANVLLHQVKSPGSGPYAYHNLMQIRLPASATPDDIAQAMYDAGIDKPGPADESSLKRFGENRLMSVFGSQTNANTETLGKKREEILSEIKTKWGVGPEDLQVHHGANGRIEILVPQSVADKMVAKTGVKDFHHNVSGGDSRFVDIVSNPHQALLSTTTRWSEGVPTSGMSSSTDVGTGGADYVFFSPRNSANGQGLHFSPSRMFRRTDFYANTNDKFGKRLTNVDVMSQIYHGAYETMFKHRASMDDAMGYVTNDRDNVIKKIKAKGITHIGGRTVEQFVVSNASQFTPPDPLVVEANVPAPSIGDAPL